MRSQSDPGLWVEHGSNRSFEGQPALFLDRDGVVVEEVDYLGRAEDVRMVPGIAQAIAAANARDFPVILVTNQSGIARGFFGWDGFAAVQARIADVLKAENAWFDLVLACGHHAAGRPGLDVPDHPWRKPNPGMLLHARGLLAVDLAGSHIVGDKFADLEAGARAGLPDGTLVLTGYGRTEAARSADQRAALAQNGFSSTLAEDGAQAVAAWLSRL